MLNKQLTRAHRAHRHLHFGNIFTDVFGQRSRCNRPGQNFSFVDLKIGDNLKDLFTLVMKFVFTDFIAHP
jgi:hypothetical protein